MITLPEGLATFMKGQKLDGLKPFAILFRNKWVLDDENESESGTGAGHYELESTPIDISEMIVKPNTLSMTLDVNEIAQYNCNNITLTLSDPKNKFIEGVPDSYFPAGYQLYGSRVVLYYGTDITNRTPIFTGVIKELPTHKPEKYQVELKLVSPLELLKDIEAKEFSNKVTGEALIYKGNDDDGHYIYWTSSNGVGGFYDVYADGNKIFDGIDYQVSQTNSLGLPAVVTIINPNYYPATITADYLTWKTNLTVEEIVQGLVALAGYDSTNEDIRSVVWNVGIRNSIANIPVVMGIGYYPAGGGKYTFNWLNTRDSSWKNTSATNESRTERKHILPENFETEFNIRLDLYTGSWGGVNGFYQIGADNNGGYLSNGVRFYLNKTGTTTYHLGIDLVTNGSLSADIWGENFSGSYVETQRIKVRKLGDEWYIFINNSQVATFTKALTVESDFLMGSRHLTWSNLNQVWRMLDSAGNAIGPDMQNPGILTSVVDKGNSLNPWGAITTKTENGSAGVQVTAYFSSDGNTFGAGQNYNLLSIIGRNEQYLKYILQIVTPPSGGVDLYDNSAYYISTSLKLQFVNLSGKTVLEALQDFALISGYEFGVDRQGVFFFRPRIDSTSPIYELGHDTLLNVETLKKNLSDFFTKLTLTFATYPLEFYANEGSHPTPIDRYGVINKDIDKPDIVNYDNPELAQAIGPQLLEIYSSLSNTIQATGKLNLALELGDIVNLKRNYYLTADPKASEYNKFERQDTYYRACKITGMNYNFDKKQITYTLRDVSNSSNMPERFEMWEFVYDFPIELGAK